MATHRRPVKRADADPQTEALYVANKMGAIGTFGNVSISDANRPVTDGDLVMFDGSTGLKIMDSGFAASDFLTSSDANQAYQRSRRYVANGETRTIYARTSEFIVSNFEVEAGGILELEPDGIFAVG